MSAADEENTHVDRGDVHGVTFRKMIPAVDAARGAMSRQQEAGKACKMVAQIVWQDGSMMMHEQSAVVLLITDEAQECMSPAGHAGCSEKWQTLTASSWTFKAKK